MNPKIGFKRIVRIMDVTPRVLKWLNEGSLVIRVLGEVPNKMQERSLKTPRNTPANELERLRLENQRLRTENEELRLQAGESARGMASKVAKGNKQIILNLSKENEMLRTQSNEASGKKSGACVIA